ncbi:protealysin inhibitor emfourin [Sodalis ligni]|jgi:hypothetical protein|uniref:Uncharacterized protein n=1 Tax=Sodalis ligni TaxID=2697027 RepID=A0A4R1NIQ0_9GAMM|nr:protealysin inhibitor emfourin [Sodalis ligni]TCL06959.1 hypothetical protein EZJ58_5258 [Sodalis ligni]
MDQCPVLDEQTVIEVSREGGFAYIPALLARRRFSLGQMPSGQRERLCALIRQLLMQSPPGGRCPGSGDTRYYRIHILRPDNRQSSSFFELLVPEASAPSELARFWQEGRTAEN